MWDEGRVGEEFPDRAVLVKGESSGRNYGEGGSPPLECMSKLLGQLTYVIPVDVNAGCGVLIQRVISRPVLIVPPWPSRRKTASR